MLMGEHGYNGAMLQELDLSEVKEEEVSTLFGEYVGEYGECLLNTSQRRYFGAFQRGLLSDMDRKSIEPIALEYLGEREVRGFQQFFGRSLLPDAELLTRYQELLAGDISAPDGFLSVDDSAFVKKGSFSAGVARQYCGRLGKTENCQAGVFLSYASEKGYGLLDRRLYLPKGWFSTENSARQKRCRIPHEVCFQTKNQMAADMIGEIHEKGLFNIRWIGCDAAFGRDHSFLRSLPEDIYYFAATHQDELVFPGRPEMNVPVPGKTGRPYKHPRPSFSPVSVGSVALDASIPWFRRSLAQGVRGPIYADIKCVRCVSCESTTGFGNYMALGDDQWLYIRRYENGDIKYFLSNSPETTPMETLDRLATLRWSIEQCFQECKSYLGMTHYETRSYIAWHRHMLMVMIAHLFTLRLRLAYKKTPYHHAHG
jgi:SRSO17 transposase